MGQRVHTSWLMRERYHRAAWAASVIGGVAALAPTVLTVRASGLAVVVEPGFILVAALLLAAGILVPRWIILALWRRVKLRHYLDGP